MIKHIQTTNTNINEPVNIAWKSYAIHIAAMHGHLNIIRELLMRGAYINCSTKFNQSALSIAANYGRVEVVRSLLKEYGVNINEVRRGDQCIIQSVDGGRVEVIKLLLEMGAKVRVRGTGDSPLHHCLSSGEIAELLIKGGGDVNERSREEERMTPLHAAEGLAKEVIKVYVREEGDLNEVDERGYDVLHCVIDPRVEEEISDVLIKEKMEIIKLLIDLGANPNVQDKKGLTIRAERMEENS